MKGISMKKKWLLLAVFLLFAGCEGYLTKHVISVSRSNYQPKIDSTKYQEFKGKAVSFSSIKVVDQNVTDLTYYSNDHKVAYILYYEKLKPRQPVASYFWYTLEKSLQHVGMFVIDDQFIPNVPGMNLIFTTLTDSEAVFCIKLEKNERLLFEKILKVTKQMPPTNDKAELETRAYRFLDLIAETILSDSDFKKAFL